MLDEREKMQIAEIVIRVIDCKLDEMRKEIIAGFVEVLDWHNDNFAKIMAATNEKSLAYLGKQAREVIEVRTREYEERKAAEQATARSEAVKSGRRGFVSKTASAK